MKYLKKFNENSESDFDLEFAISKIKEKYSESDINTMFDNELLEWVHLDWEDDGYDSEYDWYINHNNGEAQDVIIEQIIDWYKKEYNKNLSTDDEIKLFKGIKSYYKTLDYL